MNLIRITILLIIIQGMLATGFSQENKGTLKLSVTEAQTYAIEHNRTVQSARIDIKLADKKIQENLAIGFPQVEFDANYLHQFIVPMLSLGPYLDVNSLPDGLITGQQIKDAYKDSPPIPLGVKDNTTMNLTLSQLIFNGQYFVGLQATKVLRQVSEKALVKTEDMTSESVAGSYYLILVLQENIKILNESLRSVDQTYNEMVKMNQLGLNEATDVDQISINRSNIKTLIAARETQKEIAVKLLKFQLGLGFEQPLVLTDSLQNIIDQGNLMYLTSPEYKVQNSIDWQIIANQEKISELMVKLEKSKYLPSISAFYRHQEQTNQPEFNFAVKDVVGASLSFPIVTSSMRSSRVSQAKYDLEKVRLNKADAEQSLLMEFETALSGYQTAYGNFNINKESMDLSRKVFERTVIKYREGVSSSFELSQNQDQYLNTESNYINSLLVLLNARAKLDRILKAY